MHCNREWAGVVCLNHLIRAVGVKNTPVWSLCRTEWVNERHEMTKKLLWIVLWHWACIQMNIYILFTHCMSVCMCVFASVCLCAAVELQKWTDKHTRSTSRKPAAERVTLENKYASPPAPLVELWYQLAQHTILCSPLQSTGLSGLLNTNPAGY